MEIENLEACGGERACLSSLLLSSPQPTRVLPPIFSDRASISATTSSIDQRRLSETAFDPRCHRRRDPQRLVDADEVVPERIQRDHVLMVLQLLAEAICQPGKPPHR